MIIIHLPEKNNKKKGHSENFPAQLVFVAASCYNFLMTHTMNLDPAPFTMIESGKKTIELRLYDEKMRFYL